MEITISHGQGIASHHSMRGIAAVLVVVFHFKDISYDKARALDLATSFFGSGYLWVDFFFILSGFIISYVYRGRLSNSSGQLGHAARKFYIARFARLYPLHLFCLAALLAVELSAYLINPGVADAFVNEKKSFATLLSNLVLVQSWGFHPISTSWNVPSWSISAESACYLLFPLAILMLRGVSLRTFALLALSISMLIYGWIFARFSSVADGHPLLRSIGGFAAGMSMFALAGGLRRWNSVMVSAAQVLVASGILISMHYGYHQALIIFLFAILVLLTSSDAGVLPAFLKIGPILFLGTLSYSIYLGHWIVYRGYWIYGDFIFGNIASFYGPRTVTLVKLSVLFSSVLLLALVTYRWIEMPARRYINSRFA